MLAKDDVDYQKFRTYARNPENQRRFLAQPLPERKRQIRGYRAQSETAKSAKADEIMDVTPAAVESGPDSNSAVTATTCPKTSATSAPTSTWTS